MPYITYLTNIQEELQRNNKSRKTLRLKAILRSFGYSRRTQAFVNDFNATMEKLGLFSNPALDMYIPLETKITIFSKDSIQNSQPYNRVSESEGVYLSEAIPEIINVEHDFFYYLFDFGSELEYERFQACLDSKQPMGIFLVPNEEDFFSEIVVKILSYELIRKYQYTGSNGIPLSSKLSLSNSGEIESESDSQERETIAASSIFRFNQSTMSNVLLGTTGLELLDSEKFDEKFDQLSLYANKYNTNQFFILFHCPSKLTIQKSQREDLFGQLIDRVASKIPFTFTLRCRYANEQSIETLEQIQAHFRLLLEMPNYDSPEDDISILDYFLELHKSQIQAESLFLLKIDPEPFRALIWGRESSEHIYLKYFAIRTLMSRGYPLSNIHCEASLKSGSSDANGSSEDTEDIDEYQFKSRPDVYVEEKIVVEVETLRGKEFRGGNVFLDLIDGMLAKSLGWPRQLQSLWLVLPGFEIARNYYQLKKVQEVLKHELEAQFSPSFKLLIMAPDYENQQLAPVSFDRIAYPSFSPPEPVLAPKSPLNSQSIATKNKTDFSRVVGLKAEKEKLRKLLKLQEKGLHIGVGGILFFGLPGCGKTLMANAFANESERYFFSFSPADIISTWIGQSQKNIKNIFEQAKKKAPAVLFIDELDSIGFNRDDSEFNAHTDQRATINQLLIELNNAKESDVIVTGATNFLSRIDSALKRSGRLDWKIPIFPPDQFERADLFQYYLSSFLQSSSLLSQSSPGFELIDFNLLGERSSKFTSSDIELVCREVYNAVLLEEIDAALTTSDLISYISNFQDSGLTLNQEQVTDFLSECKQLSIKSPKLSVLQSEWGITDY